MASDTDTIVAQATAIGRSSVAIVRVSGPLTKTIANHLTQIVLTPRYAHYGPFYDSSGDIIDQGIAIYFEAPHSFTGEDVLELQGHGGPIITDLLLRIIQGFGARLARPGEFSERAFINDKMDLTQAEAIADLINSSSEQAARCALRTLQGEFSRRINQLIEGLIQLRAYVEAAIDFPEEEIDFIGESKVSSNLEEIIRQVRDVLTEANQGATLREGMSVVVAGQPNAGKSSLLNKLSGRDSAIVTDIPGTTRDLLREHIHIDGMPLHIIDTAGLRVSADRIEQEGIRRAMIEIQQADRILLVVDSDAVSAIHPHDIWPEFVDHLDHLNNITIIQNKVDKSGLPVEYIAKNQLSPCPIIRVSVKENQGIDLIKEHLKECMGFTGASEGSFNARRRHIQALEKALMDLCNGQKQLKQNNASELLAEDLRQAQQHLSEITGAFTSDDLLGEIFSSFCIGK
ncbi:MAG: tRNA uridine-5-carboxymethylaminomethyl(34) synthesis GTPase MnmE [Pseudomonadales bacterium]|nr:tRNA uridine-5-carboxymethylaminomethyl(34) synthesis GTPase MnmE [Pseudomonadales bacterium]